MLRPKTIPEIRDLLWASGDQHLEQLANLSADQLGVLREAFADVATTPEDVPGPKAYQVG